MRFSGYSFFELFALHAKNKINIFRNFVHIKYYQIAKIARLPNYQDYQIARLPRLQGCQIVMEDS
jgi:hypothetical protein